MALDIRVYSIVKYSTRGLGVKNSGPESEGGGPEGGDEGERELIIR
jgi:hypothetical protein